MDNNEVEGHRTINIGRVRNEAALVVGEKGEGAGWKKWKSSDNKV